MKISPLFLMSLLATTILALSTPAWAHAFLDHADPKVGSTIDKSPGEIRIWFTEEVEPTFSTIEVLDSSGKQIDLKDTHQDPNDAKLLIVSVPSLGDGEYKVVWSVVAIDTHHTQGDFKFTIKSKG
jgi:copper resistance protein C